MVWQEETIEWILRGEDTPAGTIESLVGMKEYGHALALRGLVDLDVPGLPDLTAGEVREILRFGTSQREMIEACVWEHPLCHERLTALAPLVGAEVVLAHTPDHTIREAMWGDLREQVGVGLIGEIRESVRKLLRIAN